MGLRKPTESGIEDRVTRFSPFLLNFMPGWGISICLTNPMCDK